MSASALRPTASDAALAGVRLPEPIVEISHALHASSMWRKRTWAVPRARQLHELGACIPRSLRPERRCLENTEPAMKERKCQLDAL